MSDTEDFMKLVMQGVQKSMEPVYELEGLKVEQTGENDNPTTRAQLEAIFREYMRKSHMGSLNEEDKAKMEQIFNKLKSQVINDDPVEWEGFDDLAEENGWWQPATGKKIKISEMKTSHLFNSLRWVFNSLVPANLRIDGNAAIFKIPTDQYFEKGKRILKIMFFQIGKRDNLTDEQFKKLKQMAITVREML